MLASIFRYSYRSLRATPLVSALASPPLNCEGVAALNKNIGADCKACHQDFR